MKGKCMFLFVSVLLTFHLPWVDMINLYVTDVDVYGLGLVANEDLVVSIIDRFRPRVAVYRPYRSDEFCRINMNFLGANETYLMRVALPRNGSRTPHQFFFQIVTIDINQKESVIVGVAKVSLVPCGCLSYDIVHFKDITDYSLLGVSVFGDIDLYTDTDFTYVRDTTTTTSSLAQTRPWPDGPNFVPYAIDVAYGQWGVIAGAILTDNAIYVPALYLITFPSSVTFGSHNYVVLDTWKAPITYPWQSQKARTVDAPDDFNIFYSLSVSINNQGDILFGVQSMNTVFQLYVDPANATVFIFKGSRIYNIEIVSIGFGKSVAWLDDTTAVILANNVSLDYTSWESSEIEIYDLSNGQVLNDTLQPYSSFPTTRQPMYSILTGRILLMTASYAGSIIFMDSSGDVYVILPSPAGYFTATHLGKNLGSNVYSSPSEICPEGSATQGAAYGKNIFNRCKLCPVGTYRSFSTNDTAGCVYCNATEYFCSLAAVAEVPIGYLDRITQATTFPEPPDLAGFEDILLFNMFNINLQSHCLATTPLLWISAMLGLTLFVIFVVALLTLIGKCDNVRQVIESAFKHFDILSDGERWISGVLSLSIFIIIIIAALFTNSFLQQYPSETSRTPDFTCDETIRNSQFTSQMRSLGTPIPTSARKINHLLNSQQFTLTVTLLNTNIDANVTAKQIIGARTTQLRRHLSVPNSGCLIISCNLTSILAVVVLNVSSYQTIGGVRIGLSASSTVDGTNIAQEVAFSNSFNVTHRIMSQQPYFTIELIQVINETKPLAVIGTSNYSGLWIPTFTQDSDRNFYSESGFEQYHTRPYTLLTIDIQQGTYYIYNIEKPIVKTTAVIFKNFLFASMCMEIFGFVLLIFKLAIMPLVRLIIRLIRSKKDETKEDDNDESEEEEEVPEESDSEDDRPQIVRFGPGENQWYKSDVQIE